MRVNHWVLDDRYGAGRAAIRISNALNSRIDSKVYCICSDEETRSEIINLNYIEKGLRKVSNRINYEIVKRYKERIPFHIEKYGINYHDTRYFDADVIHLHYVNYGLWSDNCVGKLLKLGKPVVWTLHDMWPFSGGCHYNNTCNGYINRCGKCPVLESNQDEDISYIYQERKRNQLSKLDVQFVGCSTWITKEANKSYIGKSLKRKCINIPNPVDIENFYLEDKKKAREMLSIPSKKVVLSFGAMSSTTDSRKGYGLLKKAITCLDPQKYMFLIFGSEQVDSDLDAYQTILMGRITDDSVLRNIYAASDVFLAPSIQENQANTVMEALSCGTPVVAFDIGGMPDMILHKQNGYLATPFSIEDYIDGIVYSEKIDQKTAISDDINNRFSPDIIAEKYLETYIKMMRR